MGWIPPHQFYGDLFGPSPEMIDGLADRAVNRAVTIAKNEVREHKWHIIACGCVAIGGGGLMSALIVALAQGLIAIARHAVFGAVSQRGRKP